jgi:signal transduction histidine kinase
MRVRWPDQPDDERSSPRKLFVGVDKDFDDGPAIIVADTGTGFQDSPDRIIKPFFTRKPNGMGLGLYYANLAMELSGGKLLFPDPADIDLPRGFDGAVAALIFKEVE